MTDLKAKPIVKDQYWIVTDGDKKVGNIQVSNNVYEVKLSGNTLCFNDIKDLSSTINIDFVTDTKPQKELPYPEYPTTKQVYNSILDIQRKLHLFTKTKKSKCYHAAGYFVVDFPGEREVVFCPKYIFIQRYDYLGPFKTKQEAEDSINS
jgi:hypothetical protein